MLHFAHIIPSGLFHAEKRAYTEDDATAAQPASPRRAAREPRSAEPCGELRQDASERAAGERRAGCERANRGLWRDAGRKLRRTNQLLAAEDARRVVGPQQAAGGDGLRTVNGCRSRAAARCEQTNREWRRVVGPRSVGDDRLRTGYEARRAANHSERAAREGTPAVRRFSAYNELRVSASRKRTGRKPPLRAAKKRASPPLRACPRRLAVRHSKCFT